MAEKKTAREPGCFGKNLAVIRAALHLSQEQLGEKVGLSHQQVYRYEQGLAFEPLHSTVERVAAFAGVSQEQLTHALLREGDIHVDGR